MAGILSEGMILSYKATGAGEYTVLTNLQEVPELGNGTPEKIDVTVLTDKVKKSITGLGDSAQDLAFKFLFEEEQFTLLNGLDGSYEWKVELPETVTTAATFTATPSVKFDGAGVNAALTYTLNLSVESEIVFG